ncbi:hypothetical protein BDV30DRAFT_219754 [Aspergillus minisclerotigenes]|uniref:Uncharacterized protein n=1 Tax=Aspergillus minisclerotigenes TaxID=656917 RepID=A0A5N6ILU1_9EURO|nr:hypothetical protein BDV30DRAFT_219754 [Aspergillus minisclerotigenes]
MSSAMSFSFQGDQSSGDIFMITKHRRREEGKQKEKKVGEKERKKFKVTVCLYFLPMIRRAEVEYTIDLGLLPPPSSSSRDGH